jgi:phi13 family phage major tail protein
MERKYDEFVGVDSVYAAIITQDTAASFVTEAPEFFAPTAEIVGESEVSTQSTYYDNVPANNYVSEGATRLTITFSGVPADKYAKYTGKYYDAATGRVYDSGEPAPPDCALSFRFSKGKNGYRYYQYLKGTFEGGNEEAVTKAEGNVDVRTYQMTFVAVTTTHQWTIDGVSKPLKRIFADTTDESFDASSWFSQVQTPTTVGAPDEIALSSSNPEDGATGFAKTGSLTLTFNNAIASYAVTLINKSTFAVIAATLSLDATKKTLTINPNTDLAASTDFAIIASKVTDIYNQDLLNTVIDFTTGA